ncbi:hypothetical protein FNV43_RR02198 [Rhamnella rubrinervis]|uniref:Retrotransposon Copia-like N-terminal domain-containing protein n=1 Tax=Rhamnella rubrinervis TaxID=2594499 RepID=A0A8K0HRV7_9ROSA|nr:hypothetical protein FNV43_RR02198 [Rhamnella rubrinervis]
MNHNSGQFGRIYCFKDRKVLKGSAKATKKLEALNNVLDEKGLSNILWWNERMQACRKPSTVQLVKRLEYSNLLGLDVNLKSGSELLVYLTVNLSRFLMALRMAPPQALVIGENLVKEAYCGENVLLDILNGFLDLMSSKKYENFLIRFNGKNYSAWAFHFEIFVKGRDLWGHIDGSNPAPDNEKEKDQYAKWEVKDNQVKA